MKLSTCVFLGVLAGCKPATLPTGTPSKAPRSVDLTATLHLIDVGQGAATLIEFPCGAMLVDTGGETGHLFNSGKVLNDYLEAFFARRPELARTLDLLVLTHPHLDHTRNARAVVENFTVKNVVTDGEARGSGGKQQAWVESWARAHAKLEVVAASDIAAGGKSDAVIDPFVCQGVDPKVSVLWGGLPARPDGWQERAYANHNNHSIVVRVDHGRASFILNGDLEEAGIEGLLEKHRGTGALDADVWQVGHHGSYNATTVPMLEALTPRIALIPMGPPDRWAKWTAWQFGHPRKKAVDRLLAAVSDHRAPVEVLLGTGVQTFELTGIDRAVYATGWDGHVAVRASPAGTYEITTSHPVHATLGVPTP